MDNAAWVLEVCAALFVMMMGLVIFALMDIRAELRGIKERLAPPTEDK